MQWPNLIQDTDSSSRVEEVGQITVYSNIFFNELFSNIV